DSANEHQGQWRQIEQQKQNDERGCVAHDYCWLEGVVNEHIEPCIARQAAALLSCLRKRSIAASGLRHAGRLARTSRADATPWASCLDWRRCTMLVGMNGKRPTRSRFGNEV